MQQKYNKQIAYWLIFGGLMVLLMVIIGGITRLTHSGLSIVTWQPIKGILPPMNEAEWQAAFEAYKKIPEYNKVHFYFTLQDFKHIFFWEYLHRMLGRSLGIVFFIPFLYFLLTKKIRSRKLLKRLLLIFFLGGLQGFAGWYMVKSGLVENTSVDHVRLAIHMSMALIILTSISWTVFELLFYSKANIDTPKINHSLKFVITLVAIQIIYGGLTAGLKAGYVFPTYPKMGTKWFPDIARQSLISDGILSFINFPASVQFVHRWLGFIILCLLLFQIMNVRKIKNRLLKKIFWFVILLISLQFTFGVFVLLLKVPIHLAVTHQVTAFLLFISLLFAYYLSKRRRNIYSVYS